MRILFDNRKVLMKYDKYKDSGTSWIGKVPADWQKSRLKFLFIRSNAGVWGEEEKGDINDIACFRIADFDYQEGCLCFDKLTMRNITPKELDGRILTKGSLLIEKSGGGDVSPVGRVVRFNYDNKATCSNFIHFVTVNEENNSDFLFYYFYAMYANKENLLYFNQTTGIQNLKIGEYLGQSIFLPTPEEQQAIVAYLEEKCEKINANIKVQKRKIDLFNELKQTVITKTVTMGLDPQSAVKDSGVQWIGKIPIHWNVCRLKNYCSLKARIGWKGLRSDEFEESSYAYLVTGQDFGNSKIDWSKCYQINKIRYNEDPYIQLENGDLLITKDGTIGKIAIVDNLDKPACLNSGVFVLKQTKNVFDSNYLYWSLYSSLLKDFNTYTSTGTTILHLYQNVFENMPLLLPPLPEQKTIAAYLEKEVQRIDTHIIQANKRIELLEELKRSIITEAITGKFKVI